VVEGEGGEEVLGVEGLAGGEGAGLLDQPAEDALGGLDHEGGADGIDVAAAGDGSTLGGS
jgi:hypothetical protein